jgi:hypothetical protein
VLLGHSHEPATEHRDLLADGLPGRQQRPSHLLRGSPATSTRTPLGEASPTTLTGDQAEGLEDATDLVGKINAHAYQLRAGGEQGADQVAVFLRQPSRHADSPIRATNSREQDAQSLTFAPRSRERMRTPGCAIAHGGKLSPASG